MNHDIPNDPAAIVDAAIANELEGHKILHRGKEAADNPLAKATFEFLAGEEIKHIEIIKNFAREMAGGGHGQQLDMKRTTLAEAGAAIKGIFERFGQQFEEAGTAPDQRMDVYETAMDMERRGYEFYSTAAGKVTDPKAKAMFEFLAAEEQRHFQMIQDTHDFLEQPDALLAMEERWMQI